MMDFNVESITGLGLGEILFQIGPVGYGILAILLVFSIVSWAIIFYKYRILRLAKRESQKFLELYDENSDLGEVYAACVAFRTAPVVRVFKAGYLDLQRIRKEMMTVKAERKTSSDAIFFDWIEDFTNVLQEALVRETTFLERFLNFLAITSSSAPLLGLLGTVWGVMVAFWSVGMQGYTSLSVIAPGVSAALVTTIGGLATAIPAAIAYNTLLNRTKVLATEIECFASRFTGVVRRELRKAL
jgi:biopolymer transport protein TolQ